MQGFESQMKKMLSEWQIEHLHGRPWYSDALWATGYPAVPRDAAASLETHAVRDASRHRCLSLRKTGHVCEMASRHEETPSLQAWFARTDKRTEMRMRGEQSARGFNCRQVKLCHFPGCIHNVPIELLFNVRDEDVRFCGRS